MGKFRNDISFAATGIVQNILLSLLPLFTGICVTLEDTYKCECPHHFRGKHCEQEIQSCRSALCKNGADCVDAGNGDFECVCREGGPNYIHEHYISAG